MYKPPSVATRKVIRAQAVEQAYDCLIRHVETAERNIEYYTEQLDKRERAAIDCGEEFDPAEEYDYRQLLEAQAIAEIYTAVAILILNV